MNGQTLFKKSTTKKRRKYVTNIIIDLQSFLMHPRRSLACHSPLTSHKAMKKKPPPISGVQKSAAAKQTPRRTHHPRTLLLTAARLHAPPRETKKKEWRRCVPLPCGRCVPLLCGRRASTSELAAASPRGWSSSPREPASLVRRPARRWYWLWPRRRWRPRSAAPPTSPPRLSSTPSRPAASSPAPSRRPLCRVSNDTITVGSASTKSLVFCYLVSL
jgi:hypothetical protein